LWQISAGDETTQMFQQEDPMDEELADTLQEMECYCLTKTETEEDGGCPSDTTTCFEALSATKESRWQTVYCEWYLRETPQK
jgi:hypothetical protein